MDGSVNPPLDALVRAAVPQFAAVATSSRRNWSYELHVARSKSSSSLRVSAASFRTRCVTSGPA